MNSERLGQKLCRLSQLQLRVLRLGFLQDGDVGIGVFPEREEVWYALSALLWGNDDGQDIAEYAVMLAVILVIVVGTIRLIGANANNVFTATGSSIAQ